MLKMKLNERVELVKAMDTIARSINDEAIFENWLMLGVADGDIDKDTTNEDLKWYCTDEEFKELMNTFLWCMSMARKSGGLYCDEICGGEK